MFSLRDMLYNLWHPGRKQEPLPPPVVYENDFGETFVTKTYAPKSDQPAFRHAVPNQNPYLYQNDFGQPLENFQPRTVERQRKYEDGSLGEKRTEIPSVDPRINHRSLRDIIERLF